jgi:hypothetical protein
MILESPLPPRVVYEITNECARERENRAPLVMLMCSSSAV